MLTKGREIVFVEVLPYWPLPSHRHDCAMPETDEHLLSEFIEQ